MELSEMFEAADDEFLKFDRIPEAERRHPCPDICALMYLHEKIGCKAGCDFIEGAAHDVIFLPFADAEEKLTQADVIYLHRCGVHYDEDSDGLAMFA